MNLQITDLFPSGVDLLPATNEGTDIAKTVWCRDRNAVWNHAGQPRLGKYGYEALISEGFKPPATAGGFSL